MGATLSAENFAFNPSDASALPSSDSNLASPSAGIVALGASSAAQPITSSAGKPSARNVGTPGSSAIGTGVDTATARRRPERMCGITLGRFRNPSDTSPVSRSGISALSPLYGTLISSVPLCSSNSTEVRCASVPAPLLPALSWPGLALACRIRSATVWIFELTGTTSTSGWFETMPTASKSRATS